MVTNEYRLPPFLTSLLWCPSDQLDQDAHLAENYNPTKIPLDFNCIISLIQPITLNMWNLHAQLQTQLN